MTLSRHGGTTLCLSLVFAATPAAAQDVLEAQSAQPPERIDVLQTDEIDEPRYEDCSDEQDAAEVSGEIVVCRRRTGDENRLYNKEAAARRHAERTQGQKPVDVAGPGIFRGPATVGGLCLIPPCPRDPVLMIDVESLPEAPPGSDADRMARGLAPRGNDIAIPQGPRIAAEPGTQEDAEQLGLPPPLAEQEGINPSESASPEAAPQDSVNPSEAKEPR